MCAHSISQVSTSQQFFWAVGWEQEAVPSINEKACVSTAFYQKDLMSQEFSDKKFHPILIYLLKTLKCSFLEFIVWICLHVYLSFALH